MRRAEATLLAVALACAGATGCTGGITQLRPVTVSMGGDDAADFERVVQAVRSRYYVVGVLQLERRRMGLRARYQDRHEEEYGSYRIAIECQRALCTVTPLGHRVERVGDHWELPEGLKEELLSLRQALGGG